jgi:uncharacterized protein (TIGR02588 family)
VVVVVAAVGFMLYQALSERGKPVPRVTIQVDTVAPYSAGHVVQIIARNEGGATATNVLIEGALRADTGLVEKSQTTVDFVPAWLAAEGGPLLHEGPRAIPPGNPPARVRPTLRLLFHLERIRLRSHSTAPLSSTESGCDLMAALPVRAATTQYSPILTDRRL